MLGPADVDEVLGAARARPGRQRRRRLPQPGSTRLRAALAGRRDVGLRRGRRAGLGLPRGGQPHPGDGLGGRRPRLRGPGRSSADAAARPCSVPPTPSTTMWQAPVAARGPPRATSAVDSTTSRSARPRRSAPDPAVRRSTLAEIDLVYPAAVAMYTEEVGVSPEAGGGAAAYRARVAQLISQGLVVRAGRGGPGRVQGGGGRRDAPRLPAPGRLRRARPARRGAGHRRPGGRGRDGAARDRAGGVALRQRLERPGAGGVRADRLRADRHLHDDPVLRGRPVAAGARPAG